MRRSCGTSAFRSRIPCCSSTAQATAFTTLGNSARMPSPVSLTTRPWCSAIFPSTKPVRTSLSAVSVPASSALISRLYPTTSAARIALRRRSIVAAVKKVTTVTILHRSRHLCNDVTFLTFVTFPSPLHNRAGPGQSTTENHHQHIIAGFYPAGAVRFIQGDRHRCR